MSKKELLGALEAEKFTKQKCKQYCGTPCNIDKPDNVDNDDNVYNIVLQVLDLTYISNSLNENLRTILMETFVHVTFIRATSILLP